MRYACFVVMLASALPLVGCGDEARRTGKETPSELVENGAVYERAVVELHGAVKIVLPKSAVVRRSPTARDLQLFMAKRFGFFGFPPAPLTLRGARAYMGCAMKAEGRTLCVATYGEWHSHIEGSADMRLIAIVPETVQLEQRDGLSGKQSIAQGPMTRDLFKAGEEGYWYAPKTPAKDWTPLPSIPDLEETAKAVLVQ